MSSIDTSSADSRTPDRLAEYGIVGGVVDIHTHFMPQRVLDKVWSFFDALTDKGEKSWPIAYRSTEAERIEILRSLGARGFTALAYPHRPEMAAWLNDYTLDFAARTPGCAPSATFYPEASAPAYVREALDRGVAVWKAHVQVGAYDPLDPLLEPVWGMLADAQTPVVIHCGSGPHAGLHTGPGPIAAVLDRHPSLVLVIAHMGMPEYAAFLDLAQRYPGVHLDTTMAFTAYMEAMHPYPRGELARLADLGDQIVWGSDFPNIPHPYLSGIEALIDLDLGDEWLRAVLQVNGARLLRL